MEVKSFVVINKTNGLPILAFSKRLPNFEEPPLETGLRLLTEKMIELFRIQPWSLPFVSEDDIRTRVPQMFSVRELPYGIVLADEIERREKGLADPMLPGGLWL